MTCASGSAVEHLLAKEGVAGSIPVSRSFCALLSGNLIVVSCNPNRNPEEKLNFLYAVTISIVQMLLAKAFEKLLYSHHGWYSYGDMEILMSCRLFLLMRTDASSVSASRLEIREVRAKK